MLGCNTLKESIQAMNAQFDDFYKMKNTHSEQKIAVPWKPPMLLFSKYSSTVTTIITSNSLD